DCLIDNGNHLILGGNEAIFQYLEMVDAPKALTPARWVRFPFIDIETDEFWTVAPSAGRIPWWLLSSKQRIPGTRFADYLAILKMRNAGPNAVLSDYVDTNQPIFDR
ncbi:MAG: amine oxidase, partial [Rhodospirillales bacterium]|nr:amine oxidase [Rhodospirillales bacterium]